MKNIRLFETIEMHDEVYNGQGYLENWVAHVENVKVSYNKKKDKTRLSYVTYSDGTTESFEAKGALVSLGEEGDGCYTVYLPTDQLGSLEDAVEIVFGKDVTSIEELSLTGAENLKVVTIPDTVTNIDGLTSFALDTMYLPGRNTEEIAEIIGKMSYHYADSGEGYIYRIYRYTRVYNDGHTDETDMVWYGYIPSDVYKVILNDIVTSIDSDWFYGSNVTAVEIPTSVTHISRGAFYNGNSSFVTNITYQGTMEQWNAIEKEDHWNQSVRQSSSKTPAVYTTEIRTVHCIDGDVTYAYQILTEFLLKFRFFIVHLQHEI